MTFRRPIKLPFESTMAFSKIFTVLPKTGGTLRIFLRIHFFVDISPLVYFLECSSSAVSIVIHPLQTPELSQKKTKTNLFLLQIFGRDSYPESSCFYLKMINLEPKIK